VAKAIQAIRGMNDILPTQTPIWQYLESTVAEVLHAYGFQEIRMPLLEKTDLFCRSIGEVTDIVEKEMYTFADRNGDSLTLRPEGTASCVRAAIENGLLHNQIQRLWYTGAMFRHERPQKGRYRQFHQIGAEVYGLADADIDAEIILLTARLWQKLGIKNLELHINSLGSNEARAQYRDILVAYLTEHSDILDEDSQRRLHTNPLRVLDSKNPAMQTMIDAAPQLLDHLDEESAAHFDTVKTILDKAGIDYVINPRLVRGLDYYNRTVFEWVTTELGAQGTVCAGGRYDGLVEQIGGKPTVGTGFAMGIERLIALLEQQGVATPNNNPHAYLVLAGEAASLEGLCLAETLRTELPTLRLLTHCGGGSFKSQFKKADKSGALVALVLGDEEINQQTVTVKYLREDKAQETISQANLADTLKQLL